MRKNAATKTKAEYMKEYLARPDIKEWRKQYESEYRKDPAKHERILELARRRYKLNRDRIAERNRLSNLRNRVTRSKRIAAKHAALKAEAIVAYGGRCACCGESNPAFLTIDHRNNDGKIDGVYGPHLYKKLKKEGWPDRVRLMCWNCNSGRGLATSKGICPHRSNDHVRGLLLLNQIDFQ